MDQLRKLGHSVDKVEFILMGGTFMSLPVDYRDYFVRNLHDALSGVYGVPEKLSLNCCGIVSAQCQLHLFMFWGILWSQDLVSVEELA